MAPATQGVGLKKIPLKKFHPSGSGNVEKLFGNPRKKNLVTVDVI